MDAGFKGCARLVGAAAAAGRYLPQREALSIKAEGRSRRQAAHLPCHSAKRSGFSPGQSQRPAQVALGTAKRSKRRNAIARAASDIERLRQRSVLQNTTPPLRGPPITRGCCIFSQCLYASSAFATKVKNSPLRSCRTSRQSWASCSLPGGLNTSAASPSCWPVAWSQAQRTTSHHHSTRHASRRSATVAS